MQLVSITIYNRDGRLRTVAFETGKLNIITGHSRTGKSSLITIVDYCLGRDSAPIPRTKWFNAIAWYVTIWQFDDGSRALLGRPKSPSEKGTERAMLEFGGSELVAPSFEALRVNTDSNSLRTQVGARIGLANVSLERSQESLAGPFAVGLGTAALFSFQEQHEISNKVLLFHRQDDHRIAATLKDTLPFFLGAVQGEQAAKRARLRVLEREARRTEGVLERYQADADSRDVELRQLTSEASAVGLLISTPSTPEETVAELNRIRFDRAAPAPQPTADLRAQNAKRTARERHFELSQQLTGLLGRRDLLLDQQRGEGGYSDAIELQIDRLQALDILPSRGDELSGTCPICGNELTHPDPIAGQMRSRVEKLHAQLADVRKLAPYRRGAVAEIDQSIQMVRSELNEASAALTTAATTNTGSDASNLSAAQEFVRGRIDAILTALHSSQPEELARLTLQREIAAAAADALRRELDGMDAGDRLASRLSIVGSLLAKYAKALGVEQAGNPMRLDIPNLTVVVDTAGGPLPLQNIGSGENWVGYHLATHLALHEFFITHSRPTPRILMIDQPSQAHFQSSNQTGESGDRDNATVRNLYKVIADFAKEFEGRFQVIAIEHADFEDDWFQSAIDVPWRDGVKLVPDDWVDNPDDDEE